MQPFTPVVFGVCFFFLLQFGSQTSERGAQTCKDGGIAVDTVASNVTIELIMTDLTRGSPLLHLPLSGKAPC